MHSLKPFLSASITNFNRSSIEYCSCDVQYPILSTILVILLLLLLLFDVMLLVVNVQKSNYQLLLLLMTCDSWANLFRVRIDRSKCHCESEILTTNMS